MDFNELREKFSSFTYKKYAVDDTVDCIRLYYEFNIDGLSDFTCTWEIKKLEKFIYDSEKVDALAFSLGLIESLSVWKLTCAKNFNVSCYSLNKDDEKWFKKLLVNGMGEFFYKNNIDIKKYRNEIITFNSSGLKKYSSIVKDTYVLNDKNDKIMIPIGGGKDSAVSIELLKELDRYCFIVNPRKATLDTFEKSGIKEEKLIIAKRNFDSKIVDYNKQGFLNGHTPFSALVSFASVLAAYINGIKYVALSNESSANESTVKGLSVNHQYSKTYEYESDFIEYENRNIHTGVKYFSMLRPFTEVGIARLFSTYHKYHKIFRSCNVGSKEDKWCCACAKCLFVYIILLPFIEKDELIEIFGKDLLDDMNLKNIFDQLIGIELEKPFECVGSRNEVNAALYYVLDKFDDKNMPKLLKYYKGLNIKPSIELFDIVNSYDVNNHLPERFEKFIKND